MRRSPRLDHSQEAEKELAVAALLACTAEVCQPTFGVAREEHVRLPLAVALGSPVVVVRLRMTTHGIRPARALPDVVGGRAPPTAGTEPFQNSKF